MVVMRSLSLLAHLFYAFIRSFSRKEEYNHLPAFVSGGPAGASIDCDMPVNSGGLRKYHQKTAYNAGFTEAVSFYSLSRATAEVKHVLSPDLSRIIMGHVLGTRKSH